MVSKILIIDVFSSSSSFLGIAKFSIELMSTIACKNFVLAIIPGSYFSVLSLIEFNFSVEISPLKSFISNDATIFKVLIDSSKTSKSM